MGEKNVAECVTRKSITLLDISCMVKLAIFEYSVMKFAITGSTKVGLFIAIEIP